MTEFLAPGQIEEIIDSVTRHGTGWILAFAVFSMFIENVFPPYPGDAAIFAAGFISGSGRMPVVPLILLSTVASVASIMVDYVVGRRYGREIFGRGLLKFMGRDNLPRIERWFDKFGNYVLVASRFLAGTRALIAVFAGVGRVSPVRMVVLSTISVIAWNSTVILLAYHLRTNWEQVYSVFSTYNRFVFVLIVVLVILLLVRFVILRRRSA
jgi:membrane protein DedA with SNARE-associated domain